jgi:hypothetical protein
MKSVLDLAAFGVLAVLLDRSVRQLFAFVDEDDAG